MAGSFAKLVGAQQLVLNHIGSRFPAVQNSNGKRTRDLRVAVMKEVERQASEAWGMGNARAAVDFMKVWVHASIDHEREEETNAEMGRWVAADAGEGASTSANGRGVTGGYNS